MYPSRSEDNLYPDAIIRLENVPKKRQIYNKANLESLKLLITTL